MVQDDVELGKLNRKMDVIQHRNWWQAMMKNVKANQAADPNYFATNPELLQTEADFESFVVGNGEDIYRHMCPAIETAQEEVVLITCFWARSASLDVLVQSLRTLSDRVVKTKQTKIRVFIGFSSLSALQKLFHTRSTQGRTYPPSQWKTKLWLPEAVELPGLDIHIKSIFVLPFSVMHPKFVIIDRKAVFLPSCNVSWESWFEGCILLSGPIVDQFVKFWEAFYMGEMVQLEAINGRQNALNEGGNARRQSNMEPVTEGAYAYTRLDSIPTSPAVFLPSPHHANPSFSLPWQKHNPPPPTPLNIFILEAFRSATSNIYMQTPNVTSPPVLVEILHALRRGVNVHILTSERLMILEQLVTAGTTTARCIKKLIKLYKRLVASPRMSDEESGVISVGSLRVDYYQPVAEDRRGPSEPVQSHLKLTIVDNEWTILGSGNMDRASWYTSQELGVALRSQELAQTVKQTVGDRMTGRTKLAFDSSQNRR